jgi:hypothetical protein
MFTNKKINGYVHATRYIMSWVRVGGQLGLDGEGVDEFREWLKSLHLNEDDIDHIVYLATNGKLELEHSARKFLNKNTN